MRTVKTFYVTFFVSLVLIIGGFLVPPVGVIDGSVITSVGLLLMFAVVAQIPSFLKAVNEGKRIKLQKGDFSVEASASTSE